MVNTPFRLSTCLTVPCSSYKLDEEPPFVVTDRFDLHVVRVVAAAVGLNAGRDLVPILQRVRRIILILIHDLRLIVVADGDGLAIRLLNRDLLGTGIDSANRTAQLT